MCQKREVDERRLIAIAPLGVTGASRGVFHDADLKALLKQFGTVQGIRQASFEQLAAVKGINRVLAQKIKETL